MSQCIVIAGINYGGDIVRQLFISHLDRCGIGGEGRLIAATHQIVPYDTGKRCDHYDEKQKDKTDTDQYLVERVSHCPCCRNDRSPGTTACCAGRNLCNGFAAFNTCLNSCGRCICSCFCTFSGGLCCGLFGYLLCRFGGLGGSLTNIVLTISHLLFGRLCHNLTSKGVGNGKRP